MAVLPISLLIIAIFTTACLASSVIYQDDSSPSCTQVLGKKTVCNLIPLQDDDASGGLPTTYKVLYKQDKTALGESHQQHDCHIDGTETLRLALDRITMITDVFVDEDTLEPALSTVTLRLGKALYECELSDGTVTRFGKSFAVFSCDADANTLPGRFANEIDITSRIHRELNLVNNQRSDGLTFDWLVISSNRTRRSADDGRNEKESGLVKSGTAIRKQQCPPIQPYLGMPRNYNDYKLIQDGSINELLLRAPCRDGYKFSGQLSEINQCKNGVWQGNGFPECEVLRTKTPPIVEHATWNYVHNDTFHEVLYTCAGGYYLSNNTGTTVKVTYKPELDNWSGIPECKRPDTLHFTLDNWPIFVSTAAATLALVGALLAIYVLVKRMAISKQKKLNNLRAPKNLSATLHKPAFACQESDKKITKESLQPQKRSETLFVGKEDAYTKILDVKEEGVHNDNGYMKTNDLLQRNFGHEEPAYEEIDGDKTKLLSSSPV